MPPTYSMSAADVRLGMMALPVLPRCPARATRIGITSLPAPTQERGGAGHRDPGAERSVHDEALCPPGVMPYPSLAENRDGGGAARSEPASAAVRELRRAKDG